MNLIHLYAVVSEPFIPATTKVMREALAPADDTATWVSADEARALASVPAGTEFTVPPVLFQKIADDQLESYREQFGGADD
jgi:methionyl-tRNA synthetase